MFLLSLIGRLADLADILVVTSSTRICLCVCLMPKTLHSENGLTIFLDFSKDFPQASPSFVNAYKSPWSFYFQIILMGKMILIIFLTSLELSNKLKSIVIFIPFSFNRRLFSLFSVLYYLVIVL